MVTLPRPMAFIGDRVPVIIFDDFTTDAKYVDFPFKVKSSAIKILTCRSDDELSSTWYELMSRISFDPTQHKRYYISSVSVAQDIPLPGKAEQQKIADCLGSLDDLIAAEGRKLEALRQHKQGLMQQLFPQPGETVPRLRFPEFAGRPRGAQPAVSEVRGRRRLRKFPRTLNGEARLVFPSPEVRNISGEGISTGPRFH